MSTSAFDPLNYRLDLLCLPVELAEDICECYVCLAHVIYCLIPVLVLEQYQCERELALGCLHVTLPVLDLEKVQYDPQVLLCLLVVVPVDGRVGVVLDHGGAQVLLDDELAPDLDDLLVEVLRIDYLALLLEDLAHVEVGAAKVDGLGPVELGLELDRVGELVEGLLGGVGFGRSGVLVQEEFPEGLVQDSTITFDFVLGDQGVFLTALTITSLVILVRGVLK